MEISRIYSDEYSGTVCREALDCLLKRGVIIYPTDTVYGLGTLLVNKQGIEKILKIKNEERSKRLTIFCRDISHASSYGLIDDFSYKIMKALVPGPYTFILPAMPLIPRVMLSRQRTIGIRIPENSFIRDVVDESEMDYPIVNSSLNLPVDFGQFSEESVSYNELIDMAVLEENYEEEPSTVISLLDGRMNVLRIGKGFDYVRPLL